MPDSRQYEQLIYEEPAPKVARIVMNRPSRRNAQGITLTYELDDAFRRACHDDSINVIILAAAGDHWNAGHDISGEGPIDPSPDQTVGLWGGSFQGKGWEGSYAREKEIYLEISERWRNSPKPTIAEIQGSVISGGMMRLKGLSISHFGRAFPPGSFVARGKGPWLPIPS